MHPNTRGMQGMGPPAPSLAPHAAAASQIALHELQIGNGQPQIQNPSSQGPSSHYGPSAASHDDFFDQMLSTITSWSELAKSSWDLAGGGRPVEGDGGIHVAPAYDESSLLASRLRKHQISGGSPVGRSMMMPTRAQHHQQVLLSTMAGMAPALAGASAAEPGLLPPLPLSLGGVASGAVSDSSFKSPNSTGGDGLFNGFGSASIHHLPQSVPVHHQSFGGAPPPTTSTSAGGSGPPRQRVRARRGQATDPHSIAERLRRERIAERMKVLQELVPNANKTDKASMLDEIIDYVKFLQLQVKMLSMSRLGSAAVVADISSEGSGSPPSASAASESMAATEHQVARLMEEDMGSAMQYLQGKGLCLMPISLASVISASTSRVPSAGGVHPRASPAAVSCSGADAPSSLSFSVLTVHSAVAGGCAAVGDVDITLSSGED